MSSPPLSPTFYGHIASTQDALLLFEASLSGIVNHVARRPHDRERASLIKSGNVFIYEEHSSGIKRWTDGVPWSPSRILGNFLVYRELERPFPPGEKKRAMKRNLKSPGTSKVPEPFGDANNGYGTSSTASTSFKSANTSTSLNKKTERSLIGSLVDSYGFKEDGLVKKTVSVTIGGVSHHLVSYYTVADVLSNKFNSQNKDSRLQHITPRPDLITKQNFRTPIDEVDSLERLDDRPVYNSYPYARNGYEMTNQSISHRQLSLPTPPMSYTHSPSLFEKYSINSNPGIYADNFTSTGTNNGYNNQFASAPGIYSVVKHESHDLGGSRQQRFQPMPMPIPSNASRPHAPTTIFSRRSSTFEQGGSMDSGTSGASSGSMDSKVSNDSGYSSQGFYGGLRDISNFSHSYPAQRSLPTPASQPAYERPHMSYADMDNTTQKENAWPMGNVSVGHGHYIAL